MTRNLIFRIFCFWVLIICSNNSRRSSWVREAGHINILPVTQVTSEKQFLSLTGNGTHIEPVASSLFAGRLSESSDPSMMHSQGLLPDDSKGSAFFAETGREINIAFLVVERFESTALSSSNPEDTILPPAKKILRGKE